ncbi:RNA polymerase sigma factor [Saccharicrinis sp. 156]|uniref:RNA polymerase sigma factor n=1 Tax=Saccharicrinis sp. 156 TaxID=3417574 RepID=UPI003D359658
MAINEHQSDGELINKLKKNYSAAFDTLFEVYSPKLFGFALKYFKNENEAEELVQDVFITVWENRHSLNSELSFKSYLFTIALNKIRAYFNKKAVYLRYVESLKYETELVDNPDIENNYESVLQEVKQIIEEMPARKREIFMKSKLEGKNSKQIAAELNITPGTVDNQVSEALRYVRSRLKNENASLLLFAILFIY